MWPLEQGFPTFRANGTFIGYGKKNTSRLLFHVLVIKTVKIKTEVVNHLVLKD